MSGVLHLQQAERYWMHVSENKGSVQLNEASGSIGRLLSVAAPWASPIFGVVLVLAILLEDDSSPWRVFIGILATLTLTLGGIVWKDLQGRQKENAEAIQRVVEIVERMDAEHNRQVEKYTRRQERMVGVLIGVALASQGKNTEVQSERLMEQIKSLLDRES
jgi:hypothetical protein